jgi:saccharopine dehydrogenase (NAD+, L-lysine-forming)
MFEWGLKNRTKPPYGAALQMNAKAGAASLQMNVSHSDAYFLTAASAVACVMQYCNGTINKPGLSFQGDAVEPIQFFKDMERLGVTVQVVSKSVFA